MIKWGLISQTDANCLMKTIDLISNSIKEGVINCLEIGTYSGESGNALRLYIESKSRTPFITGIDNNKDGEPLRFKYDKFIVGDADEVVFKIADNSQHLIFIDGCHCFAHVVSNFFSYAPKVKVGGFLAFHDTGAHIKPFKDFQHGDKENPDAYISVRKALNTIGLFNQNWGSANYDVSIMESHIGNKDLGWELIYDEADPENDASGICCFKKLL